MLQATRQEKVTKRVIILYHKPYITARNDNQAKALNVNEKQAPKPKVVLEPTRTLTLSQHSEQGATPNANQNYGQTREREK